MYIKTDYRDDQLFKTSYFSEAFRDLFYPRGLEDENKLERGPLTVILEDFPLVPAKGGGAKEFIGWPDITYFVHVLNAMVVSGKILEYKVTKQETGNPEEREKFVRLFFSALAMHDVDKLFQEGVAGANNLPMVLEKNKQKIIEICSYYLNSLGSPKEWWNDLVYLILRTENRSMDYANSLETKLNRTELATLSQYLKLGDQVGGIKANTTDAIFHEISKHMEPMLSALHEQINLIHFTDLPQILLLETLTRNFDKFLKNNSRHVLINFPDAIAYLGSPLSENEYLSIYEDFSKELGPTDDNIDNLLESFAPSGNSIRLDFSFDVKATTKVIKKYIEKFGGRLIIWQGEQWKTENPDFDNRARSQGVPIFQGDKKGKKFFYLKLPEESEEQADVESQKTRFIGLIACAQRVLYSCEQSDLDTSKEDALALKIFGNGVFNASDSLQKKTVQAICHAAFFKDLSLDQISDEYERICTSISSILVPNFDESKIIDYREFFDRALGNSVLIQEPPDKSQMCLYCGIFAEDLLKEENSFGIKATSGTGKKITVLKYDKNKFNGKICKYCSRENSLRRSLLGKENESLCMHVYLGDYIVPVNLEFVVDSLRGVLNSSADLRFETEADSSNTNRIVFRVGKRSKKDLGYHMILFVSKPKKKIEEFYTLFKTLNFISKTGVKIRLTSLISSKKIFDPMFEWDNAPSWVKNFKMDKVRIDQIETAAKELDLIYWVSKISKKKNALAWVIHEVNRGKRGIFQIIYRNMLGDLGRIEIDHYSKVKEGVEWYMEKYEREINKSGMAKVVEEACGIATSGPKSNNENTWMMREAMKLYLRYFKADDNDLKEKIAGKIWEYAKRQKYSGKETQIHAIGFSEAFVDFMRKEFKNRIPGNDYRKDLIAQFALVYNLEMWKKLKSKKKENEKNE
ncbi:hypothetical protein OXIME_000133 [Oxyplasma meridianum]|uniref:Type I-D CRISPR-associated protein Cas10d/Csc3 n=1 Tax=Oxyplasma meridianum TaxID=3073602 RepID=A0AAX4NEP6_9ARCH